MGASGPRRRGDPCRGSEGAAGRGLLQVPRHVLQLEAAAPDHVGAVAAQEGAVDQGLGGPPGARETTNFLRRC